MCVYLAATRGELIAPDLFSRLEKFTSCDLDKMTKNKTAKKKKCEKEQKKRTNKYKLILVFAINYTHTQTLEDYKKKTIFIIFNFVYSLFPQFLVDSFALPFCLLSFLCV